MMITCINRNGNTFAKLIDLIKLWRGHKAQVETNIERNYIEHLIEDCFKLMEKDK